MRKIIHGAKRVWENELVRWRGYIVVDDDTITCEYIRTTRKDAIKDAKKLSEEKEK